MRSGESAVEGVDGFDEGDVVQSLDEVDDVAVGAAAEAGEPVRHPGHGHRGGGVVVERAAADEPVSCGSQLDPGGGHDILDRVVAADRRDIDLTVPGGLARRACRLRAAGLTGVAGVEGHSSSP